MILKAGYKNTEVGLIPSDWEVKWLGEIATCYSGGTPNTSVREYYNGNINWISSSELNKGRILETDEFISELGLNNSSAKMVPSETFLLAMYGATAGVSAITYIEGAINQAVLAIIPKDINTEYIFQYFRLNKEKIIKTYTQGGQPNLSGSIVKSISIPLPPTKAEQAAIATALSDADALISSLEKLIAKKRHIKQGVMQKLLLPKDGWEVRKLGEVCLILNNLRIPIKESSRIKGETPYYGANGIQGYIEGFTHNGEYVLVAEDGANDLNNYPINYTSGKIWVNNHAHVLQGVISILSTKFLSYILKSIDFQDVLVGGTRAKLNKSILDKIEIPFPSLIEQKHIATILSDMDAEISALESKLEKYRKIKMGMMQELLTGKIRLIDN